MTFLFFGFASDYIIHSENDSSRLHSVAKPKELTEIANIGF